MPEGTTRADAVASVKHMLEYVAVMRKAGVPIVAGTDGSGLELVRELELYVEGGMTPAEALATATIAAARNVHIDNRTGSIVAGKEAKQSFDTVHQAAAKLGNFAQEEGLIVRPLLGDRIALCPPLVISEAEIGELFDRLERALAKVIDWATKEKLVAA